MFREQVHAFGVKLETAFEKLFKFSVQGAGQLFDRVIGQNFRLADDASHQREEIKPQPPRQAELVELVFELFSDFAQIVAAVTRTGVSEHQVTNRTKMQRGDERSETASLFGQKPQILLCFLEINLGEA